jgi:preprotein translocase subunit SecD
MYCGVAEPKPVAQAAERGEELLPSEQKGAGMATTKQKQAARRNIVKARRVQSARAHGTRVPRRSTGLSTAEQNRLPDSSFAFPEQRKEPLTDAEHVRNAVARFDQVEGVSDADRDRAWKRIRAAARTFDVEIEARGWRQLFKGGKAKKA